MSIACAILRRQAISDTVLALENILLDGIVDEMIGPTYFAHALLHHVPHDVLALAFPFPALHDPLHGLQNSMLF